MTGSSTEEVQEWFGFRAMAVNEGGMSCNGAMPRRAQGSTEQSQSASLGALRAQTLSFFALPEFCLNWGWSSTFFSKCGWY